ncbi:phospholipid transfer protein C2CD2L [Corythoichthys intestinalis]|uniref:phospholipid transfer protein C2CD2L n=1 Tax=Corythoichthys intestinalis TaxID=161448 RepID=UPI0025A5A572|nr:phospholipid transfer protein C2CD2L [Corythoichthys intestinalis]XP_057676085.1 phospholipid transfer protein C2CD2L [Corythoichthys intestinalis]
MELQELGWLALVGLFLASLLIVLAWLFQFSLSLLRQWRTRKADSQHQQHFSLRQHLRHGWDGFVRFLLNKLRPLQDGGAKSEAGLKGLLTSLFSFKSISEQCRRSWVKALNEQACRNGSSIQITFDSGVKFITAPAIESVTCSDQSAQRTVLHCKCRVDTVAFPVTVTQQSPAAVAMDTYQITIAPTVAKVVVCLEEVKDEGILVSWTLSNQQPFKLTASPCKLSRHGTDDKGVLDVIKSLIEDTLFSSHPAMILNLRTFTSSSPVSMEHLSVGLKPVPQSVFVWRLLLRQLRVTLSKGQWCSSVELCCILSLNQPSSEKTTCFMPVPHNPKTPMEWKDEITMELSPETKELRVRLLERNGRSEQFLLGHGSLALDLQSRVPTSVILPINLSHTSEAIATVTADLLYVETEELRSPLRSSLTPTKKVDVDRSVMPDGTIVTTVTTVQSRLKLESSQGDSPLRSPSKVEVTEKKSATFSNGRGTPSPDASKGSRLSNGLDPVAETAIRQLTDSNSKMARKTPTKRSTLIISGVTKIPLAKDDCTFSSGYAASMDAAMQGNHYGTLRTQEPDETTPSDVSERPSVDDVESDTGSIGGLETRSLKEHKVGFLQSGSRLLFRRRYREKEPCLSQSHEDISKTDKNFSAAADSSRKKSGSFSRRLIKRFSFRTSGKRKCKATSTNGGESSANN